MKEEEREDEAIIPEEDFRAVFHMGGDLRNFKGYKAGFHTVVQERPAPPTEDFGSLGKKAEEYLRKLIQLARDEGIALYFICAFVLPEE